MTKPKSLLLIPAVAALITPAQADLILNFTENTGAGTVEFNWEGSLNLAPFVKGPSGVFASPNSANTFRASDGNFENYAGPFTGDFYFPVGPTFPAVGSGSTSASSILECRVIFKLYTGTYSHYDNFKGCPKYIASNYLKLNVKNSPL